MTLPAEVEEAAQETAVGQEAAPGAAEVQPGSAATPVGPPGARPAEPQSGQEAVAQAGGAAHSAAQTEVTAEAADQTKKKKEPVATIVEG